VTLYFSEGYWTAAAKRTFNVVINGTTVLTNFDIFATAGAQNKAVQRSFTATANASGQIVINFNTVIDNAQIKRHQHKLIVGERLSKRGDGRQARPLFPVLGIELAGRYRPLAFWNLRLSG